MMMRIGEALGMAGRMTSLTWQSPEIGTGETKNGELQKAEKDRSKLLAVTETRHSISKSARGGTLLERYGGKSALLLR